MLLLPDASGRSMRTKLLKGSLHMQQQVHQGRLYPITQLYASMSTSLCMLGST